jgi:hypothetical protein
VGERGRLGNATIADDPVAVDDHRRGHSSDIKAIVGHCAVFVEHKRKTDTILAHERHDFWQFLFDINTQHREVVQLAILSMQGVQVGHLGLAGRAPGRPEVQQHDLASQIAQAHL